MSKTLLLADDSVTIQKVVGISFASEDVELVTVDNGDDALVKARELRPDLILADVVMPGLNGYELCEAVQQEGELSHIPVVLLTGTFEAFDEDRAKIVGASGHVSKPFEAQTLVAKVKELLARTPAPAVAPATPATPAAPPSDSATSMMGAEGPSEGDAFDFFDDDLEDIAPPAADVGTAVSESPAPAAPAAPEALGIDASDSGFAFADDDLAVPVPPEAPADSTVAILPDDPESIPEAPPAPAAVTPLDDGLADLSMPLAAEVAMPLQPEEESFDFAMKAASGDDTFSGAPEPGPTVIEPSSPDLAVDVPADVLITEEHDDSLLRVGSDDLAQATVLDPESAAGYDVSSSDLGNPLADAPPPIVAAPELAPDLASVPEVEPAPIPEMEPMMTPPPLPDAPIVPEPAPPAPSPALAALEQEDAAAWAEPIEEVSSELPVDLESEPVEAPRAELAEIAPALRHQLHETLERVAWDAMGGVTEKLVADAVARIEKIAWEVIPQLAETIIREEIRRLKGESGD